MKKNRIMALALTLAMASSMVVGAHAADPNMKTDVNGEFNQPTIGITIPAKAGKFLINPYELKTELNEEYYEDQIISPTYVLKNTTPATLTVKVAVKGTADPGGKLIFANTAPEDETATKSVLMYLAAGDVMSYDDELADPTNGNFDAEAAAEADYTGPILVSPAERKGTLGVLKGNDPAVKGDFGFMGFRFFGSAAKNPSEDWTTKDFGNVSITWTFIGGEGELPDYTAYHKLEFAGSDMANTGVTKVRLLKKSDVEKLTDLNTTTDGLQMKKTSDSKNYVVEGLTDSAVPANGTHPIVVRAYNSATGGADASDSPALYTDGDWIAVIDNAKLSDAVLALTNEGKVSTDDGAIVTGSFEYNKTGSTTDKITKTFKIVLDPVHPKVSLTTASVPVALSGAITSSAAPTGLRNKSEGNLNIVIQSIDNVQFKDHVVTGSANNSTADHVFTLTDDYKDIWKLATDDQTITVLNTSGNVDKFNIAASTISPSIITDLTEYGNTAGEKVTIGNGDQLIISGTFSYDTAFLSYKDNDGNKFMRTNTAPFEWKITFGS